MSVNEKERNSRSKMRHQGKVGDNRMLEIRRRRRGMLKGLVYAVFHSPMLPYKSVESFGQSWR